MPIIAMPPPLAEGRTPFGLTPFEGKDEDEFMVVLSAWFIQVAGSHQFER
jgi:hypothetical protein